MSNLDTRQIQRDELKLFKQLKEQGLSDLEIGKHFIDLGGAKCCQSAQLCERAYLRKQNKSNEIW